MEHIPLTQQVPPLQLLGRHAQLAGRGPHRGLEHEDPLRPAEPAEGGVGRQVGAAARGHHAHVRHGVGVRGVEQGALENRDRQVRRAARILVELRLVRDEAAGVVEAEAEVRLVGVTLAGDAEVLAAVRAGAHRAAGPQRGHRGEARPERGLVLLAAECPAQADHVDLDGGHRQAEHSGDRLLDRRRRLGAGVDHHAAGVGGDGQGGLGLHRHVLLGADRGDPGHHRGTPLPRGIHVPGGPGAGRHDEAPGGERLAGVEDGGHLLEVRGHRMRAAPRGLGGLRQHEGVRFPDAVHLPVRQHRLAGQGVSDLVLAGDVRGGEDGQHAGDRERRRGVHRREPGVRVRRDRGVGVQAAGRPREVGGEAGSSGHEEVEVLVRAHARASCQSTVPGMRASRCAITWLPSRARL